MRDLVTGVSLLCLFGCHHGPTPIVIQGTLPVAITAAPQPPQRTCPELPELPTPPDEIKLDFDNPDVISRTTVHIGQYNALRQFSADLAVWAQAAAECIHHLAGGDD